MFPKSHRIDARTHRILQVQKGNHFSSDHISLKITRNSEAVFPKSKFSVVVSKKIEKTAVLRNRSRRRVYPIIKNILGKDLTKPYTFVFFIQKSISTVRLAQLKEEIDFLLKKARI